MAKQAGDWGESILSQIKSVLFSLYFRIVRFFATPVLFESLAQTISFSN